MYLAPGGVDQRLSTGMENLQDMIEKLYRSSKADSQSRLSRAEADLIQLAREAIAMGTTIYEASLSPRPFIRRQEIEHGDIRITGWIGAVESMRHSQHLNASGAHDATRGATPAQLASQKGEASDALSDDSDDGFDKDLAKAALETGRKAFESQEWAEAESILQEALRIVGQLPVQQRSFCDIFSLHYRLAVCTYHTKGPVDAELALVSLIQQSANSDEQYGYIYDASHLLAQLCIRMGQIERARSECEKTLQGRRRLLGKRSDASLESTVLMAHIYVLLDNCALAKSCLSMIPEACRSSVIKKVENSLGTGIGQLDFSSPVTRSTSESPSLAVVSNQNTPRAPSLGLALEDCSCHSLSSMVTPPATNNYRPYHQSPSNAVTSSPPMAAVRTHNVLREKRRNNESPPTAIALDVTSLSLCESPELNENSQGNYLSRKEILHRIGCQPKDRIEEAVCEGDHAILASLLDKKKDFWKSKLRKRVRPERLTALHFAALFGDIDMARRLIGSNFNVNDIPYGYTTSLSPLKMAIGARKVKMVEFLIANGAKPSEPDSWSSLAGQLMSRSWLSKTLSEAEREFAPNWIIMILDILLKHGWEVNEPFDSSGGTVLHQAVSFWTGSYMWDLNLRVTITRFLCEQGANPFQANKEGKTPYDVALASGHQDILTILNQNAKRCEVGITSADLVELPG